MPQRAPRPCSRPGCPELVLGGGFCPEHAKTDTADARRPSAAARGYDVKWRKTRARYLRALNPLACENCGRTPTEAGPLEVDHLDGLGPRGPRGHDPTNLQALCKSCHATKTAHQTNIGGAND